MTPAARTTSRSSTPKGRGLRRRGHARSAAPRVVPARDPRRSASRASRRAIASGDPCGRRGRWRVATLVALLADRVAGMAAYLAARSAAIDCQSRLADFASRRRLGAADRRRFASHPDESIAAAIAGAGAGSGSPRRAGRVPRAASAEDGRAGHQPRAARRVAAAAGRRVRNRRGGGRVRGQRRAFSGLPHRGDAATPLGTGIVVRNSNVVAERHRDQRRAHRRRRVRRAAAAVRSSPPTSTTIPAPRSSSAPARRRASRTTRLSRNADVRARARHAARRSGARIR